MNTSPLIKVLEFRNYLLRPGATIRFARYFNRHFVAPMNGLGGYTLGQYQLKDRDDRFVWLRGFADMSTRLTFLNDFYMNSNTWKEYGPAANEMMINSDNVYLLRPLNDHGLYSTPSDGIRSEVLQNKGTVMLVDFHLANGRLSSAVDFFRDEYLPFLSSIAVNDSSLWVSELFPNDFPRLPTFQDPNLLVSITHFRTEEEYNNKIKKIDTLDDQLKRKMEELITTTWRKRLDNLETR